MFRSEERMSLSRILSEPHRTTAEFNSAVKNHADATSQKRITLLQSEIRQTAMGRALLDLVARKANDSFPTKTTYKFDDKMAHAQGSAFINLLEGKRDITLSPHIPDQSLQTTLVHELIHTVQTIVLPPPAVEEALTARIFSMRLKEGEAFLYQTIFALDKLLETGNAAPHNDNLELMRHNMKGSDCFPGFKALCDAYLTATLPEEKSVLAGDMFWTIEQGGLDHYDRIELQNWQKQKKTQDLMKAAPHPERAFSREKYYQYVVGGMRLSPQFLCAETKDTPHFLAHYSCNEIIKRLEQCISRGAKSAIANENRRLQSLIKTKALISVF